MKAINLKTEIGPTEFYKRALEIIRYYKYANSHKVDSITAAANYLSC
jgi:hypothetical protein